jgi:hypothetical protein
VASRLRAQGSRGVLGATIVVIEGAAVSAADGADAVRMLMTLSGHRHTVITAVALRARDAAFARTIAVHSGVRFARSMLRPRSVTRLRARAATRPDRTVQGSVRAWCARSRFVFERGWVAVRTLELLLRGRGRDPGARRSRRAWPTCAPASRVRACRTIRNRYS